MIETCPYPQPTVESWEAGQKWEAFLYFVWEREAIRMARENGYEKPWTIDRILEKYRFCNIRRRDDRVSRWLISEVYSKLKHESYPWLVAATCRLINWPPTIAELLKYEALPGMSEKDHWARTIDVIQGIIDEGKKAFGSAYMIYPGHEAGVSKSQFVVKSVLKPLVEKGHKVRKAVESGSVEDTVGAISGSFGMSTFMAGQVAADLTYVSGQLDKAHDLYEYAPLGPGSQEGLNYLMGNKKGTQWKQGEFNRVLVRANLKIKEELRITDLTLHDVQNCMCEASKYFRTLLGEGKPRSLYKPETAF